MEFIICECTKALDIEINTYAFVFVCHSGDFLASIVFIDLLNPRYFLSANLYPQT